MDLDSYHATCKTYVLCMSTATHIHIIKYAFFFLMWWVCCFIECSSFHLTSQAVLFNFWWSLLPLLLISRNVSKISKQNILNRTLPLPPLWLISFLHTSKLLDVESLQIFKIIILSLFHGTVSSLCGCGSSMTFWIFSFLEMVTL